MGRQRRRLGRIALVAVVLSVSGSVLAVAAAGGGRRRGATADAEFAAAVKLSLSPLISHAVALRTTLRDLTAAAAPPPGPVTENFRAWSEEFATARDLV